MRKVLEYANSPVERVTGSQAFVESCREASASAEVLKFPERRASLNFVTLDVDPAYALRSRPEICGDGRVEEAFTVLEYSSYKWATSFSEIARL